jgi:hypothetical protein
MERIYKDENFRFLKQSQWKKDQKELEEASVETEVEAEAVVTAVAEEILVAEDFN